MQRKIQGEPDTLRRAKARNVKVAVVLGGGLSLRTRAVLPVFASELVIQLLVLIVMGLPIALGLSGRSASPRTKRTEDGSCATPRKISGLGLRRGYRAVLSIGSFCRRYTAVKANASTAFGEIDWVLPFENISDDKQNSYFADGVRIKSLILPRFRAEGH